MNGVQAKKFKLPTIFGQKSAESTPIVARPSKFTNLTELASAHLSSTSKLPTLPLKMNHTQNIDIPQKSKFLIPKLNGGNSNNDSVSSSNSAGESLTPHEMSLKKIMDLKRLHITPLNDTECTVNSSNDNNLLENQQFPIDLASALNEPNTGSITVTTKPATVEKIDFKFIDCDIADESSQPLDTQDCCLNISNILDKEFENRTKSTTAFGKILCSKYKRKNQSIIYHGFESKHKITPFRFDVTIKPAK